MLVEDTFKQLPWREQNAVLEPHLRWVLEHMTQPMPTTYVAWALSERTGLDEKFLASLLLKRFAPHGDYATQDGNVVRAYGKTIRRWRWHPLEAGQ